VSGTVRCPNCGHVQFAIELPVAQSVQARDASSPDAPLLLRVSEAARIGLPATLSDRRPARLAGVASHLEHAFDQLSGFCYTTRKAKFGRLICRIAEQRG